MIQRIFLLSLLLLLGSCNADLEKTTSEEFKQMIRGRAQGTTWQVVYYDLQERDFKPQVDSILSSIDQSISTYVPGSVIDRWNKSDSGEFIDPLFLEVLMKSWDIYQLTEGAFDPTVKPLVSYWGFGPERFEHPESIDSTVIDSLLMLVEFDTLRINRSDDKMDLETFKENTKEIGNLFLHKPIKGMQLDFNAIGQGWSADKIAEFLASQGIKLYFVELGGEIVAGYPKPDGALWKFGIDRPSDQNLERTLQATIQLRNKGLATSGNYRKFYERDGVRYSHTVDPTTGYPVQHNLLSATVVSKDAGKSDALATAFMVMGNDSTVAFLNERSYLNTYVYLIQADANTEYKTYTSKSLINLIEELGIEEEMVTEPQED